MRNCKFKKRWVAIACELQIKTENESRGVMNTKEIKMHGDNKANKKEGIQKEWRKLVHRYLDVDNLKMRENESHLYYEYKHNTKWNDEYQKGEYFRMQENVCHKLLTLVRKITA